MQQKASYEITFKKFPLTVQWPITGHMVKNSGLQSPPRFEYLTAALWYVKFMFSKKATKFDKFFTVNLMLRSKCQIDGEDFVSFCGLPRKNELYLGMSVE